MRISDWSSDVCSSDLDVCCRQLAARIPGRAPALSPSEYCPSTIGYRASATTSFPHGSTADQRSPGKALIRAASDTRRGPVSLRISVSRSEEHTSELQSLMRISYAVFCLKKKKQIKTSKIKKRRTTRNQE